MATFLSRLLRAHRPIFFVFLPVAGLFLAPTLKHMLFLPEDDHFQNFPLRVLVGNQLATHHLPTFNPYIYGGTPLLAGFNSGAAYPFNWLFVLPNKALVWEIDLLITFSICLFGSYLYFLRIGQGQFPASIASCVYSLSGFFPSNIDHVDLLNTACYLPWMLLTIEEIIKSDSKSRLIKFGLLFSFFISMAFLASEPEGFLFLCITVFCYTAVRIFTLRRSRNFNSRPQLEDPKKSYITFAGDSPINVKAIIVTIVCGICLAILLTAFLWLPGFIFANHSQRARLAFSDFQYGSLSIGNLLLFIDPFINGTNQNEPAYWAGFGYFPELTFFATCLAPIALIAFTKKCLRRQLPRYALTPFVSMLLIGIILAVGPSTYIGNALFHLPILNSQRLLDRNLMEVDFALASLVGWFVYLAVNSKPRLNGLRMRRLYVPALIGILMMILSLIPSQLLQRLAGQAFPVNDATLAFNLFLLGLYIALYVFYAIVLNSRRTARRKKTYLTLLFVFDLILFNFWMIRPPHIVDYYFPSNNYVKQLRISFPDKFAYYDPDGLAQNSYANIPVADGNLLGSEFTINGYASLVNEDLFVKTGVHAPATLNPFLLDSPFYDYARVKYLFVPYGYFLEKTAHTGYSCILPTDNDNFLGTGNVAMKPLNFKMAPGNTRTFYFGANFDLMSLHIEDPQTSPLRLQLIKQGGVVTPYQTVAGIKKIELSPQLRQIAGISITNLGPHEIVIPAPKVRISTCGEVELGGRMQASVSSRHWIFVKSFGNLSLFANKHLTTFHSFLPSQSSCSYSLLGPHYLENGQTTYKLKSSCAGVLISPYVSQKGLYATSITAALTKQLSSRSENGIFCVNIPAGNGTIVIGYQDSSLKYGIYISVFGAILWALASAMLIIRRKIPIKINNDVSQAGSRG